MDKDRSHVVRMTGQSHESGRHALDRKAEVKKHTSNEPKQRVKRPMTPASSMTSLRAAELESSFGSRPPPGTIHLSLSPLDVTRSI